MTDSQAGDREGAAGYRFSPWKLGLCGLMLVALVIGAAVGGAGSARAPREVASDRVPLPGELDSGPDSAQRGFMPSDPPSGDRLPPIQPTAPDTTSSPWSPALFRGGVGFFTGLALGLALRLFVKVAIIAVGAQLLLMAGLAAMGWIDVHWPVIDQQLVGWMRDLPSELTSGSAFLTGSIPLTGMLGVGLFTGWKRR